MKNTRKANIELLRIVIMFMIILLHTNYFAFQRPADPWNIVGMSRNLMQSLTIVPVNIFVIISGYFGIRFASRKIFSLLFQSAFAVIPITIVLMLAGRYHVASLGQLYRSMNFLTYWFINAYIGLICLSPALNVAVSSFSRRQLLGTIVLLYVFLGLGDYTHLIQKDVTLNGGYSVAWFVVLYLLGAYIRRYSFFTESKKILWMLYVAGTLGFAFISLPVRFIGMPYNDPFLLLSSVSLFMLFVNIDLSSDTVLKIASCTTMVYLLNVHPVLSDMIIRFLNESYEKLGVPLFLLTVVAYSVGFFSVSIAYDYLRQWCYRHIKSKVEYLCDKLDALLGFA